MTRREFIKLSLSVLDGSLQNFLRVCSKTNPILLLPIFLSTN